eukprot:8704359-Lingulodinium_polyedra.AAC.1
MVARRGGGSKRRCGRSPTGRTCCQRYRRPAHSGPRRRPGTAGAQPARARRLAAVRPPVARDVAGVSSGVGGERVARPGGPPGRPRPRRAG